MATETAHPPAQEAPSSTPAEPRQIVPAQPVIVDQAAGPRKSRPRRFWDALKNVTLLISMIINLVLIVVVAILLNQVGSIKVTIASVLGQLDSAFEGLGQANIADTIHIDQKVPVRFDLPLSQDTTVVTQAPVPLVVPANFSLGQFGSINGTVSLALPAGTSLPVHLEMSVPVSNSIGVTFDQPVSINLSQKGLGPVVAKLRAAIRPLIKLVGDLPDAFVIIP